MDHTGETPTTTSCADGTKTDTIPTEICSTGNACSANGWATPEAATTKQICVKIPDPTPTPDNTVLPGDICSKDSQCLNNAKGVKCTGGKCVTTVVVGGDCTGGDTNPDSKICPENSYCDATKKCIAALALAATCTKATPCKSGLGCISNADGTAYT